MASQDSTSMADSAKQKIKDCHSNMVIHLGRHFDPKLQENWVVLLQWLTTYLDPLDLRKEDNSFIEICDKLMARGIIKYGSYDKLYEVIKKIDVRAAEIIQETTKEIKDIQSKGLSEATQPKTGEGDRTKGQPQAKRQRTEEGVRQQQSTEFSSKIAAMIERTKAMIEEDKKSTFIDTKGFQDAKEKLHKNRVVVIKGNTGDGKTTTAIRLILGLIEEQIGRQPLQLHNIKDLDLLPPKSKLITFIDDIFGERVAHEKDVGEWNKRIKSVLPTLCGDKSNEANFLLITIRNDVFNSLRSHSLENVFVDSNIIDLSSNDYKIKGEMLELLELYKPKKGEFSWKENEKDEIVKYTTGIGFPQCCWFFRDIPDLQKERDNFFKMPFYFLNRVLENLAECNALLFLFLNGGGIDVKNLDPNGEKVDKTLLGEAFDIDLKGVRENRSAWNYKQKIEFVRESLDTLSGFLVVKEKLSFDDSCVYRFAHNSIHITVALLYGKKSLIGFIKYCPRKPLSLLTILKTSTDRIILTPNDYVYMFERIHREWEDKLFEIMKWYDHWYGAYGYVSFLDVWTDRKFIEGFVRWLNDKGIDKVDVLNKACHFCVKPVVLYLLSNGAKPNEDTDWWSLVTEGGYGDADMDTLKELIIYMTDQMKLDVLNKSCLRGFVECALYLLSEGVKPDKDTDWWSLATEGVYGNDDIDTLKEVIIYMTDKMKLDVLNISCKEKFVKRALYLLSEGVKLDKDTNWLSLVTDHLEGGVDMDILKEVIKYVNDEIKLRMLNETCSSCTDECVKYLLSEDVECEENTPFCVVKTGNIDVLRNIVSVINDEIKLVLLNVTCYTGLEECALYLLSQGVKPDNDTLFCVASGGSVKLLCKLVQYDVIPTARASQSKSLYSVYNTNVLHEACLCDREEMVAMLCNTYPELVHDTDIWGTSTLLFAAKTGNCGIFHTVERSILQSLYRVEDERHQCESVDGREVHRNCGCAQYMSQLVDNYRETIFDVICQRGHMKLCEYICQTYPELATAIDRYGETALHASYFWGNWEMCKYFCQLYPALTTVVDRSGRHFLHCIADNIPDVSMFTEYEILVKQYLESTGQMYDITTILDNEGRTVLHMSCESGHKELCVYLCESYPELTAAVDKGGRTMLHMSCERGHKELCVYLCQSYPELTAAVDKGGRTMLHMSCERRHKELCVYLCQSYPELIKAVDNDGRSVLHVSCKSGHKELCVYLCQSYPELTKAVDKYGWHCLHYIAEYNEFDVDMFTECEVYVKQYLESLGLKYDIKTILDNRGQSVLDVVKQKLSIYQPLYKHIKHLFDK